MRNIIDGDKNTGECLLAVNKYGLKFLRLSTRETIAEFGLSQVEFNLFCILCLKFRWKSLYLFIF